MIICIFIGISVLLVVILIVCFLPSGSKPTKDKYKFELTTVDGKKLIFTDPFDNFLVYGGANSGKTKSIGKPIIEHYIKNQFAGFIYDYKDSDLTKTANHFVKKHHYPYDFFYISFTDMDRTFRTNPVKPSVVGNESLFLQLMDDILTAYKGKDGKRDEWFNAALGILRGVAIRFYNNFPQICTIPHIANFVCSAGTERITKFLEATYQSRSLASGFLDARDSPKTQSSMLSSLTTSLAPLANEKKICYVLSGDDFDFNLIDPARPKLISVANSFQIQGLISPIVALMFIISSRRFTLANQIPFFYAMDEATTFTIDSFESLPSVLREYKCSFLFLTQSGAKIEKLYGRNDRSSLESNFGNQFYGRTKDVEALKAYTLVFGKEEKQRISKTQGSSRGGENRSRTISSQKEERYDTNFFARLESGQFLGSAAHCNRKDFCVKFKMYSDIEEPLPIVRPVLPSEIIQAYDKIIQDIQDL